MSVIEEAQKKTRKSGDPVWAVAMLLIVILYAFARVSNDQSAKYPNSNITTLSKPHDCDFLKAPIGDKQCHYERQSPQVLSLPQDGKWDHGTQSYVGGSKGEVVIGWDRVDEQ